MSDLTMRRVLLRGFLGEKYGEVWEFDRRAVASAADVVRAISSHYPEFEFDLLNADKDGVGFGIVVGPEQSLGEAQLAAPLASDEIEIIPLPLAAKGAGWIQILAGVLLIGASVFLGPGVSWLGGLNLITAESAMLGITAGYTLVLGGIMQLLFQPADSETTTPEQGFSVGGSVQTAQPGDPVPIVVGEFMAGPAPVGLDIVAQGWNSKDQEARVTDVLSEGEIEGWATGSADDSLHIEGVKLSDLDAESIETHLRVGTVDQEALPSTFSQSRTLVAVANALVSGRTMTRTTTPGRKLTAVTLNFVINASFRARSDGSIDPLRMEWRVDIEDQGATGWRYSKLLWHTDVVRAPRNYSYSVDVEGDGPWHIKVTKTSADSAGKLTREMSWSSFVENGDTTYRFPNTAMHGLGFRASDYQSVPERTYLLKGIKVPVPSNYDPVGRVYTGNWDGTFAGANAWTRNPVWIWLELVRNTRFGLGAFIDDDDLDLWSIYRAAQYCDELVDDGKGGTEPRYSLDGQLRGNREAWRLLVDLAGSFGAIPMWTGSKLGIVQDRPEDAIYEFNPTNVIDGVFTYTGTPLRSRITRAVVGYVNKDDFYSPGTVIFEDRDAVAKYGIRPREVTAAGVTSRSQATRLARRILRSEAFPEAIVFRTGIEGASLYPGKVVRVLDPTKGADKDYGRLDAPRALDSVDLDRDVELESGVTYTLEVLLPHRQEIISQAANATSIVLDQEIPGGDYSLVRVWVDEAQDGSYSVERQPSAWDAGTKTLSLVPKAAAVTSVPWRVEYPAGIHASEVTTPAGITRRLELLTPFPVVPEVDAPWILTKPNTQARLYRVVGLKSEQPTIYTITATQYDSGREAYVDTGYSDESVPDDEQSLPTTGAPVPAPPAVSAEVQIVLGDEGGLPAPAIRVDWSEPPDGGEAGIVGYRLTYFQAGGAPVSIPDLLTANTYLIEGVKFGLYQISVASQRFDGVLSAPATTALTISPENTPLMSTVVSALSGPSGTLVFNGRDCEVRWRVNNAYAQGEIVTESQLDPLLKSFRVVVTNPDTGRELNEERVSRDVYSYTYSYAQNVEDGGPSRRLKFEVTPISIYDDEGEGASVVMENPAPPIPNVTIKTGATAIWPTCKGSEGDPDFAGYICWGRIKGGLPDLEDDELTPENQLAVDAGGPVIPAGDLPFAADGGETYVMRFAAFDDFSRDPSQLNVSATFEATAGTAGGEVQLTQHDFGVAESGGTNNLVDTDKTWANGEHNGREIRIIAGTGIGQARTIANTVAPSTIIAAWAWETIPDSTSVYLIVESGLPAGVVSEVNILQASIYDALIRNLSANKITAGEIQALIGIAAGSQVQLDGVNAAITVDDEQTSPGPVRRVEIGKTGGNPEDYGLIVRAGDGTEIINVDGLGINVVKSAQIELGAVTRGGATYGVSYSALPAPVAGQDFWQADTNPSFVPNWRNLITVGYEPIGLSGFIRYTAVVRVLATGAYLSAANEDREGLLVALEFWDDDQFPIEPDGSWHPLPIGGMGPPWPPRNRAFFSQAGGHPNLPNISYIDVAQDTEYSQFAPRQDGDGWAWNSRDLTYYWNNAFLSQAATIRQVRLAGSPTIRSNEGEIWIDYCSLDVLEIGA